MSKIPLSNSSCFSGIGDDIISKKNLKRVPSTTNATYSSVNGSSNIIPNNVISGGGKKNRGSMIYPPAAVS